MLRTGLLLLGAGAGRIRRRDAQRAVGDLHGPPQARDLYGAHSRACLKKSDVGRCAAGAALCESIDGPRLEARRTLTELS